MKLLKLTNTILLISYISTATVIWAQDIPSFEQDVDETIRSGCHSFLVDMLPEDWQGDVYEATGRCDPETLGTDNYDIDSSKKNSPRYQHFELGDKQEKNLDITVECQSEYMCIEQRVLLRDADTPISQADYNRVAEHCYEHYACIESFLSDWPKALPPKPNQQETIGFSFDELSDGQEQKNFSFDYETSTLDKNDNSSDSGLGFGGLESYRQQEKNTIASELAYEAIYQMAFKKSLWSNINTRCKKVNLNYRTPGSPRTIREDMRDIQDEFSEYAACYESILSNWDAQAYADALANYDREIQLIEEQYNISLSGKRRPNTIDKEISTINQHINKQTKKLTEQLEYGPRWIESLYASGTFKRPSSGPSTLAILSKSLTQLNNSLEQQNAQRQKELNNLIQSVQKSRVTIPKTQTPKISIPKINTPTVQAPKMPATTLTKPEDESIGGQLVSFGCYAPSLQVCLNYTMPANELLQFRQRCQSQGNQVLEKCRTGVPNCEHKNFAGSVKTYNYDLAETDRTQQQCRASGGIYRAQ